MTRSEQLGKDPIQDFELSGDSVQGSVTLTSRIDRTFNLFEAVRVVTDLRRPKASD